MESTERSSHGPKTPFTLQNYDVIGFDLDHTLCRYKLENLFKLCYSSIVRHLVDLGYPKEIFREYDETNAKFCQKGLIYDLVNGNMLKLDANKNISVAFHGTRRLSASEIESQYKGSKIMEYLQEMPFIRGLTSESIARSLHCFTDYFTVGTIYLLMEVVDAIDSGKIANKNYAEPYYDLFKGYSDMYRREAFGEHTGYFFPSIKENPDDALFKLSSRSIDWLKSLRAKGLKTVVITSSNVDFAEALLNHAVGKNWFDLFDSVVTFAKKPGFWTEPDRMFYKIKDHRESDVTAILKEKTVYAMGSFEKYKTLLRQLTGKETPRMLYIGDSLTDDMYVPSKYRCCDTVGIVGEIECDRAKEWGSFLGGGQEETLWKTVISSSCCLAVPSVEELAQISYDDVLEEDSESHLLFNERSIFCPE